MENIQILITENLMSEWNHIRTLTLSLLSNHCPVIHYIRGSQIFGA